MVTLQVLSGQTEAMIRTGSAVWGVCVCERERERKREQEELWGSQQALNFSLLVNYYLNEDPQGTWQFACPLPEAAYKVQYSEYPDVLITNTCPEGEENL